ncbi:DCC1-like thiol-disulfide oxidoreductase family protein [Lewinella sp. 4G2]|uniref:DCC1-like thiol-disulfide oxidoreductase family protein n=1 Tax=Lewinella sp. 4G2 TaxID=1803372 RepID=UPI0012FB88D4|nr:DCC1-like thiol-disulfide oxidoreductase family protein [Lewinella sp. 4G2]
MANTFLYDDACPMCKGYTSVFTTLNWSKRKGFSTLRPKEWPTLDIDRGRHEIPLLDEETGEVRYGLDAMTTVVASALPLLKPLLRHPYFLAALKPLYWLITYNRRVIAGTKPPATGFDCAPDVHLGWRMTYLALVLMTVLALGLPTLPLAIGFGLFLTTGFFLHPERLDFLGNFATVVLGATLLGAILPDSWGIGAAYLFAVWEGWRRFGG